VFPAAFLNIWGLGSMSKISWGILVLVLLPFFVEIFMIVIYRIPINYKPLLEIPDNDQIGWSTLISTVVWCTTGFDSIGSVAGEVRGGKKTYILGVLGVFPLIILNYAIPVMLCYIMDHNNENWDTGYFSTLAFNKFPFWFGVCMTVSSAISNFGQLSTSIASQSRQIWFMAGRSQDYGDGESYLPHFLSWSWKRNKTDIGSPVAAIIATAIVLLTISSLHFDYLVQVNLVTQLVNLLLEYSALIRLKYSEPETPRPYVVPFGKVGAWLCGLPTLCISIFALVSADLEVILTGMAAVCVSVVFYVVYWVWVKLKRKLKSQSQHRVNDIGIVINI